MNYQSTETYRYLIFLEKYVKGDLELLHQVSQKAEEKERLLNEQLTAGVPQEATTTKYPYSFEFIFGETPISRLTIPCALMLFSTLEILGYLIRTDTDFDKTYKNFNAFFKQASTQLTQGEINILRDIYRNGIAHNYFPKLHVEISYHSSNPDKLFFSRDSSNLVLNINKLEEIVIKRLEGIIRNVSLYENMEKQLNYMLTHYQKNYSTAVDLLLQELL